jgi:hypothetical protein
MSNTIPAYQQSQPNLMYYPRQQVLNGQTYKRICFIYIVVVWVVTHAVLLDFTSVIEETTAFICRFCCTADSMRYIKNPQEGQNNVTLKTLPAIEMLSNCLNHEMTSHPICS